MTDKKPKFHFHRMPLRIKEIKILMVQLAKATTEKKHRKRKMTWIQRRVFRSI